MISTHFTITTQMPHIRPGCFLKTTIQVQGDPKAMALANVRVLVACYSSYLLARNAFDEARSELIMNPRRTPYKLRWDNADKATQGVANALSELKRQANAFGLSYSVMKVSIHNDRPSS